MGQNYQKGISLLSATTITTAVTGSVGTAFSLPKGAEYLLLEGIFTYGSGGTTAKFWIQTRSNGGTWRDIVSFAFTTASATKWSAVSVYTPLTAARLASDAALADDTILDGFIGDEIRVKYTTTGTYGGSTTIAINASVKI